MKNLSSRKTLPAFDDPHQRILPGLGGAGHPYSEGMFWLDVQPLLLDNLEYTKQAVTAGRQCTGNPTKHGLHIVGEEEHDLIE